MEKVTEWYPANVKPVHVGVYEVETALGRYFRLWDGKRWHWGGDTPNDALRGGVLERGPDPWRGLRSKP